MDRKTFFTLVVFFIQLQAAETDPLVGLTQAWWDHNDGGMPVPVTLKIAGKRDALVNKTDVYDDPLEGLYLSAKAADFFRANAKLELREFLLTKARFRNEAAVKRAERVRTLGHVARGTAGIAGCAALVSFLTLNVLYAGEHDESHESLESVLILLTQTGVITVGVAASLAGSFYGYARRCWRLCEYEAVQATCMNYSSAQLRPVASQFEQLHPSSKRSCCSRSLCGETPHAVVAKLLAEHTKFVPRNYVALQIQGGHADNEED